MRTTGLIMVALVLQGCCCCPPSGSGQKKEVGKAEPADQGTAAGNWTVSTTVDPMTDATVVSATVQAEGEARLFAPLPVITVRCQDNETAILVDVKKGMALEWEPGGMVAAVQLRFDDEDPISTHLDDSKGLSFTRFMRKPVTRAKKMMTSDKLLLGWTAGLGGEAEYATFPLDGAEEALAPVREACSW